LTLPLPLLLTLQRPPAVAFEAGASDVAVAVDVAVVVDVSVGVACVAAGSVSSNRAAVALISLLCASALSSAFAVAATLQKTTCACHPKRSPALFLSRRISAGARRTEACLPQPGICFLRNVRQTD